VAHSIYNNATLTTANTSITANLAAVGGGIYNHRPSRVTLGITPISGNHPDNCEPVNTIAGCLN
jgi:hypothetical protein